MLQEVPDFIPKPWPGGPVRTDSSEFYRVALRELYGDWKVPGNVLDECVALADQPAEAAQAVVAAWAGLAPAYFAKRLYTRFRRRSCQPETSR
jgi:hypothetical protein